MSMTNAHSLCSEIAADLVPELTQQFVRLWWESDASMPALPTTFSRREQSRREACLDRFWDELMQELDHLPRSEKELAAFQERFFASFGRFAREALDMGDAHLDVLLHSGFTKVATGFARMARQFDTTISGADIYQASRNAWTMNGLQMLLGLPVRLTPSVFAYSMLYPYTDNFLDDPAVDTRHKIAFNERLAKRLCGRPVEVHDHRERMVHDLVSRIEGQYTRATYTGVFESLMAIHRAQVRSMDLLRGDVSPYEVDVLGISVEKGGTSVLADGFLVAGALTRPQAEFMFGWGAFLQFLDDLQDTEEDADNGLLTVYSQTVRRWPLDAITNRAFSYGARVLVSIDTFKGSKPLKELMRMSATLLLVGAVGRARRFHSPEYVRQMERHSPFGFAYLDRARKRMARRRVPFMRLIEAAASPI